MPPVHERIRGLKDNLRKRVIIVGSLAIMVSFTVLSVVASLASGIYGASLQQVPNFGNNPTGAGMFIYVPDRRATNPPILVASHYCGGTAQAYHSGTGYAGLADQYGFSMFSPDVPS